MNFEAVIFDLDGTLADTLPLTVFALKEAARLLEGLDLADEEVLREFGPVDTDIIKVFVREEKHREAQELYVQIFTDNFNKFVEPIPGIKELLEFLTENNIRIGLFTGRGRRVSEIILEKLGIRSFFQTVISGELTKVPKPDPEGILIALDNLKAESKKSIYVGDFDVDIKASKAAGTTSVLALWASTASEKLRELKPDMDFENPLEFIEWLKKF